MKTKQIEELQKLIDEALEQFYRHEMSNELMVLEDANILRDILLEMQTLVKPDDEELAVWGHA
jgi:hypothetical protein